MFQVFQTQPSSSVIEFASQQPQQPETSALNPQPMTTVTKKRSRKRAADKQDSSGPSANPAPIPDLIYPWMMESKRSKASKKKSSSDKCAAGAKMHVAQSIDLTMTPGGVGRCSVGEENQTLIDSNDDDDDRGRMINALHVIRSWSHSLTPKSRKSYAVNFDPPQQTKVIRSVSDPLPIYDFSGKNCHFYY